MTMHKWKWLQLFAEGGEGTGDGAGTSETGDNSVDAGHQRLRELGVPEDKIRKRAKKAVERLPEGAVRTSPQTQNPQAEQAAAAKPTEEPKQDAPKRMTWEEIVADPEYNEQMQKTVQSRLKAAKSAEESLTRLTPALDILAKKYGQDAQNLDYGALAEAILKDDSYYVDKAMELGTTPEIARKLEQYDAAEQRRKHEAEATIQQQAMQRHFIKLENEAAELKKVYPNFDLRAEMKNPTFARMVSPGSNVPVRNAYYAVHHDELQTAAMQVTAEKVSQKISNAIQSGSRRPNENGASAQAPSVTTFDYRKASKAQRSALKREIMAAGARGEKLYPGK